MPRPRRKPSAYQRRNERARALGYTSYYDFRLHDHGRIPPGPLELTAEERSRRRGHRGRQDFLDSLREGDLILMPQGLAAVEFNPAARRGVGAYVLVEKLVISASSGRERTFRLRNLTRAELEHTIDEEQQRGAVFSPAPSLDQRRLLDDETVEGGY